MRILFITSILLLFQATMMAQSLSDLRQKREAAASEIEYTGKLLSKVQQEEKASLSRLQLINNNIKQRNGLIAGLNDEVKVYQEFIENNSMVVEMLTDDLEQMKEEYAQLIRMAYRNENSGKPLLLLLSAENFNQAYRRLLYMRRYTSFRKNQAVTMELLQQLLSEKIISLEKLKETRQQLIDEARDEAQKLVQEKNRQNQELQELKKQQTNLEQTLAQQRSMERQLEREINRMIEEEARKNRDAGEPAYGLTPEQKLVGENFGQNKQRLPWPVERGIITDRFGVHQHPVLSKVQIRNNGINITTEAGAEVRAVFNGEVTRVFGITGGNSAVIIRHGNYLSVYSNLSGVTVKKGDKVKAKQPIGSVYTDSDDGNKSILKFQIWHENQKLNPEEWIGR